MSDLIGDLVSLKDRLEANDPEIEIVELRLTKVAYERLRGFLKIQINDKEFSTTQILMLMGIPLVVDDSLRVDCGYLVKWKEVGYAPDPDLEDEFTPDEDAEVPLRAQGWW